MIFVFILGANIYFSSYMFLLLYSLFPSTHYYLLFLSPLNSEYFGWLFVYIYIISLYLPCLMLLIQKLIFFVFASMIEEKKMSYKKENQTEIIMATYSWRSIVERYLSSWIYPLLLFQLQYVVWWLSFLSFLIYLSCWLQSHYFHLLHPVKVNKQKAK